MLNSEWERTLRGRLLADQCFIRAGDLMQDLKTGALLQASPRSQFYGQMIGSLASIFVSAGAYKLYTSVYQVSPDECNATASL